MASSLFSLRTLRYQQKQFKAAQSLLLEALPIYQTILGMNHPNTHALQGWIDRVQAALDSCSDLGAGAQQTMRCSWVRWSDRNQPPHLIKALEYRAIAPSLIPSPR